MNYDQEDKPFYNSFEHFQKPNNMRSIFFTKPFLILFCLTLGIWACTNDDTPDFELGRYEYAGIDNKTFRFFRVETGGAFREVSGKKTGIGEIAVVPFCDEFAFGTSFYDCGLFPDLEKPFFEFRESEVEIAVFYAPNEEIQKGVGPYKIEGDSIVIGEEPFASKYPRPTGTKLKEFGIPWRIYQTTKPPKYISTDLLTNYITEKEHLEFIFKEAKLGVGDTIALCLLKEKFVKQ
jgi:hypothetical protein